MMINLFDDASWFTLRPLTFTRPVADLRVGILTIAEKWSKCFKTDFGFQTQDYLSEKYPQKKANLYINGSLCPSHALLEAVEALNEGEILVKQDVVLAFKNDQELDYQQAQLLLKPVTYQFPFIKIKFPEEIFVNTLTEIKSDFELITKGRTSAKLSRTNTLLGDSIFLEEDAKVECSSLNTLQGPIYLANNAEIWEGSNIRGAFSLGKNSSIKMGTKVYQGSSIGPNCRIGGEINNVVIWGNSSKGHEGYLGNSVMGEWCNLGADTNSSNLKNNYSKVKLYDYNTSQMRQTGMQFCGVIIGDHVKTGINTMFNTGTVVGVCSNIYGTGFPPNFIPDFSWGGPEGFSPYKIEKLYQTAQAMMDRKNQSLTEVDKKILARVLEITSVKKPTI